MMKLMTQLLDIESIQPSKQSNYDVSKSAIEIEALAHAIVEAQVLLSIPIVKQIDLENYELISGDLEFHSYLKALEFDANLPGRIGVYIVNSKEEDIARKQVELTRSSTDPKVGRSTQDPNLSLLLENVVRRLETLDQKIATQESLNQSITHVLAALDERVPVPLPMFQAFDRILEASAGLQVRKNLIATLGKTKSQKVVELLEDAKKNGESLGSFSAILKVLKGKKLMSEKRLIEISDDWQ
jgi:hypothetical protein